jgi:FkbM family methyltransferase
MIALSDRDRVHRAILHAKVWLIRHPLAFYLVAPFFNRPFSFRKRALQMAWLGFNARLLAARLGSFSKSVVRRHHGVFQIAKNGILVAYDFTRRDGGLHPMYIYDHVYESAESEVIRNHFQPDTLFIDVGANIGLHSIQAAANKPSGSSVLAIEADEPTYRILEANVRENSQAQRIQLRRTIIWSSATTLEWHGQQLEHGHNHASAALAGTRHTVQSQTLDSIVSELSDAKRIGVIKIDVEGAELEILRGAHHTLSTQKPALIIEIDDRMLARNAASGSDLRAYLRGLGYRSETPIVNSRSHVAANYLFLP